MSDNGIPSGSYSVVCSDGTYFYSANNVTVTSGAALVAPSVTEVNGTGQVYQPKDGDPLWVSLSPNSALASFVYSGDAFQPVQYVPGADPTKCACVSDSRKGTDQLPYLLSCDTTAISSLQGPQFSEAFAPPSGLSVSTTSPRTRWLVAAAYTISGWSDLSSTCNPSGGGPDASGMISLGQPGNIGGLNVSVSNQVALPWYQLQLYFSLGDQIWWLAGAYQPNRDCRTNNNGRCSQLLTLTTSQYGFTWVPQQSFASGYYAPISNVAPQPATYWPSGPAAVAYGRSYTGDFAANFGPNGPFAPLPVAKTVPGSFTGANQMYNPALPCSSSDDGLAVWQFQGSSGSCYFSYRWGCFGTQCLIIGLSWDTTTGVAVLQLIDEYGSNKSISLVDVDDSPNYGWLYMSYNQGADEYWLTAGLSAERLINTPKAFGSAKNWLVVSSATSTNYSAVKSAVASVWPGLVAAAALPTQAPGLLLSLGATVGQVTVSNYTTLTANQALCQYTSGGLVGMLVPQAIQTPVGIGASDAAPSSACDSLMQNLCAGPGVDPTTCCVFRSQLTVPGFSADQNAQFAACFNTQCSGNAKPGGGSLPPLGLSYQPSTTGACGNFCGNITNVQGDLNDLNSNNQTVYCSGSFNPTTLYILLAIILIVVAWNAFSA